MTREYVKVRLAMEFMIRRDAPNLRVGGVHVHPALTVTPEEIGRIMAYLLSGIELHLKEGCTMVNSNLEVN